MHWKIHPEDADVVMTEQQVYPLISFVGDVGGAAGLVLGLSVIAVIRYLTEFAITFFRKVDRLFRYRR